MASDAEFPDELDLPLRQKWYIARALIEHYQKGMSDLTDILDKRAGEIASASNQGDVEQWAYASGYAAAAKSAEDSINGVDWEGVIIALQADILQRHNPEDDPEE